MYPDQKIEKCHSDRSRAKHGEAEELFVGKSKTKDGPSPPCSKLQAAKLFSPILATTPVSIQVPSFFSATHKKSDEPFIVV
jgi:hypothetical protein